MAYDFEASAPTVRHLGDGRKLITWTITEDDVGVNSEWSLPGVPVPSQIWLHENWLVTPDAANTVQSELGTAAAFVNGTRQALRQAGAAAAFQRIETQIKLPPEGDTITLYGRSKVDAHATQVKTRITVLVGE